MGPILWWIFNADLSDFLFNLDFWLLWLIILFCSLTSRYINLKFKSFLPNVRLLKKNFLLPWIRINNDKNWCKEKNNRQTEPVIVGHWNVKIVSTTKCVWFTAVKFTFTILNNFQTFFFWLECPFNFALCSILKLHYICKYENRQGHNYWKCPYIYWYTTILFDTFLRWSRLLKVEFNKEEFGEILYDYE